MRAPPFISVITVVKNGMPFFQESIDSVINQTYSNFEYIVIDGGSKDETLPCIKKNDSQITRWISEQDSGIADAFNKGIRLSNGDYLLFLNSDDSLINAEVLACMADEIMNHDYPEFIYGDCEVIDRHSSKSLYRASIDFEISEFLRGKTFPHPSTFINKNYFEKYGLFDPDFKIAMDYEFFLRGINHSKITHTLALVTKVRDGGLSTFNQGQVANEILRALKKNHHFKSFFYEQRLRFYFLLRRVGKYFLDLLGIYKIFVWIRHKI
jgi:glycosyltransferase